jgi:hypothetical protein
MGAELKTSSTKVQNAEGLLNGLNKELAWELSKAAVDVAGIVDPTPISDVVGTAMSVASGDWVGAGLSLISIIPYAGDALAKTAKGARAAKKIAGLKKKIEGAIAAVNSAKKIARQRAAAAIRAKRAKNAAENAAKKKMCKTCKSPQGNRFETTSPKEGSNGTWKGGERGNSKWYPDSNTEKGKTILNATGGKPIEFKDGYPDFSPYASHRVEIEMTGDNSIDFPAANKAAGLSGTPKDWTWHHKEDGVTMELIPSDLNNNIPHTGGASIVKDPGY